MTKRISLKRTYENETPIREPMEVLWLMVPPWQEKSERILLVGNALYGDEQPHVRVAWYCGGYTKEEFSGSDLWSVAHDVASQLLSLGYVRGTPQMGYTDNNRLIITEEGKRAAYAYHEEKMIRETIVAAEEAQEWWYVCDSQTSTRPTCAFLMAPQSPDTRLHRGGDILVRANKILKALHLNLGMLEAVFSIDESSEREHEYLESSDLSFERFGNLHLDAHGRWTALARIFGKKLVVFYDKSPSSPLSLEKIREYLPNG